MKILICAKSLKRALDLCGAHRRNHRQMTLALRKSARRKQTEPTLCSRATLSSPFRENSISHQSDGSAFSKPTKPAFEILKNLPSARPWLFRKTELDEIVAT